MTKLRFLKKAYLLILIACLYKPTISYAQCVGCTKTYTVNTAANVTVAVGQTVCINSGVTMSGQIFLNGGVLCNSGIVNNLKLNNGRGRVNNYNIAKNIESSVTFTGNVSIYSYANSQITFTTVTINMNTADSLFFNVYNGGRVTFASNLSISSKKLSIVNGGINPAAPGNVSPTLFNIGSNLSVNNATLSLVNKSTGRLNVSGSVNLSNGGKRTIINQGILNIFNALNITGAAVGPTLIDNSNNLSITNSFSCTATSANGNFIFANANTSPGITVGQDLVLSILNCTTTNNGILNVTGNVNYTKGSFTNGNTLSCANFSIPGTATPFVNNGKSTITNLNISGTGKLTNNSLLDISQGFTNSGSGRVVLGTQSLLKTLNYSNSSTDSIIGAPNTVTDTLKFARIYITGSSTNSGAISKKVMIFDESLTNTASNIGYGFDVVTNPSKIDLNGVKFLKTTVAPGTSGVFNVLLQKKYFALTIKADTYSIPYCSPEDFATLTAAFGPLYYSPLFGFNYIYSLPSIAYNWPSNPGGLTGPVKAYSPTSSTTYSINVLNNGITYWTTVKINVNGVVASITGAPNIYFVKPNVVNLSAVNVSGGGPPYTYQWTPNSFFVNGTNQNQANAQVSPTTSVNYSLAITDFGFGCTTVFNVNVIDATTNAQIIKRHVSYNNPVNGSAFISLLGGILPHKVLWKNNLNSNYRSDLVPGATYNVRILATPTSTDTIRKQIKIGTQYSWKFKTNLTFLSEVAKRNRTDSLGLCIAENKVAKNVAGWTEIKINKLSNDITIGFCGDNNDVFLENAAYQQSFRTTNTNLVYSLMAMAVNNTLPYASNTLNLSPAYAAINMVRIKDGTITLLFRGSSNVTTYPCALNDVVKIGRNASGNMFLAVNEAILYTHNVNVNSQFLYPVFTANSDAQIISVGSGSGQEVYIDPATVVPDIYAVPQVKLDGGYYTTVANKLLFKVVGEYNLSTIKFIVYDKTNANVLSDNNVSAIIPFFYDFGDNRYALDVSSLTTAGYYILEVTNEKNEKLYLRFKHTNSGINPNPDPIDNTDTGGPPPSN